MTTLVDVPVRVDDVHLIGEMAGSGYRSPPALVQRGDGQVLQLTPLLYLVLKAVDGRRSCAEIADAVARATGRGITENDVRSLVDAHLRPLGLLRRADGSEPETRRSDPLLGLKLRVAVTNPRTTRRLTDPFRALFAPVVAVLVVAAFLAVVAWVFFDRGLGASAYEAFERPHLLLLVFAVSVLSAGFHEFGHAAATRYSGGEPGAMGAGLYLVWPAFYTDVTDSYRLDRAGRIRTDLGGLYFNAIVVVLTFVWWWATGWEALLLLVATQVLQMGQQLLPLLRFDGYHVLADLAGVPDLYQRIRPTLLGLLPHRWRSPENRALTPWARVVITAWVLVTVPLMALMLLAVVRAVPRLLGTAGSVLQEDAAAVAAAWGAGEPADVAGHVLEVFGVVLPILACGLILGRIALRFLRGLSGWSEGSLLRRVGATALSALLILGLSFAWWPAPEKYRPIQQGERGLVTSFLPVEQTAVAAAAPVRLMGKAAQARLDSGRPLVAAFEKGKPLPTKEDPALAMVLVPAQEQARGPVEAGVDAGSAEEPGTPDAASDDVWVFPFDKPLPPAEGDNQALAVATEDGAVVYDLAFAMVWADGTEVLNVNEAHAYASCTDCVAVAVAFQVVLIVEDARVVVPQNLAVAANYDCYQCVTAAIASQLVLSVPGEPGEEQLLALADVWNRLIEFGQQIATYTLAEVSAQLEGFKGEILGILGVTPATTPTPGPSSSATPSPSTSPGSATSSPSSSPTPQDTTSSSPPPTQEPTAEATQEPTTQAPSATPDDTPPSTPEETSPEPAPSSTPEDPTPESSAPESSAAESSAPDSPAATTPSDSPEPSSTSSP